MIYRTPPAMEGPFPGPLPALGRDPIPTLLKGWRQCGGVFRIKGGPVAFHIVADPAGVQHIMEDNAANYQHPPLFNTRMAIVLGVGIITSEGEYWKTQRNLLLPAFHKEKIAGYSTIMLECIAALMERWEPLAARGETIDINREMTNFALTILMKALFSADWARIADAVGQAVQVERRHMGNKLRSIIDVPERIPLPSHRRFLQARQEVDAEVFKIIAERRRNNDKEDVLSALMEARIAETGELMTDQQIRDEIVTVMIAGHDTTANALTWIWYLLSKNPTATERLRQELDENLGGRPATPGDLPQLKYNKLVIQESLRLYPPLPVLPRTPMTDDEVCGYHIPAGAFVLIPPYVTHRIPTYWENPEGFDPDRFTAERSADRPKFAYYPFAGGPRGCIGFPFTMLEMQLAVATIAQRYRLDLVPGHPMDLESQISLAPKFGLPVMIHPVHRATARTEARVDQASAVG